MSGQQTPTEIIQDLVVGRAALSDDEVLSEIEALAPLADEDDSVWDDQRYWREAGYLYVALCEVAAERKLRPAARLLLLRAGYGDPGEMMRGLRHSLEAIFNPDWAALADVCIELSQSNRPGTRAWAIFQLMTLDDPRAKPTFKGALNDAREDIRDWANVGLKRLARLA